MKRPFSLALCVLLVPLAASAEELRVSAVPDEGATQFQRRFATLGAYLEKQIGLQVRFIPVTDHSAAIGGLAAKRLDLVWCGGFTFVQARYRTGNAVPLVQREEDAHFQSMFVVSTRARARALRDLKGASFAFGAVGSTSGHLMPRWFLLQHGINPDRDFAKVVYSGAHDATARWVESGRVDAGVLSGSVFQKLLEEKRVDPLRIRVLWTTPPYPDYTWTVRGDLDPKLVEKIRNAFLALDPSRPEHKELLDLQMTKRFSPTTPESYRPLEDAAKSAGLLKD